MPRGDKVPVGGLDGGLGDSSVGEYTMGCELRKVQGGGRCGSLANRSARKLPHWSCVQPDPVQYLAGCIGTHLRHVYHHLASLWETKAVPPWWQCRWLCPIPKVPDPDPSMDDLRPLMLVEVLRKLWVGIMYHYRQNHNHLGTP